MATVIVLDGPDGCGKTEIAKKLSTGMALPYFKVSTEKDNWKNNAFKTSLKFDALLPQFIAQTGTSFVSDRGYASEWVYSRVFGRETDMGLLRQIDDEWAAHEAFFHVICLHKDYTKARPDELVPADKLKELDASYREFITWTSTNCVAIYVDEFMKTEFQNPRAGYVGMPGPLVETQVYDIEAQIKEICAGLEAFRIRDKYPRVFEIIRNGEV